MPALWQPATLQPKNAETTVALALKALLTAAGETGIYFSNKVPQPRQARMIIVNRDGGAFDGLVDRARIRFRVYDDGVDLARTIVRLLPQLRANGTATYVEHLSGPLDVTDESEDQQFYLLFEIHLRGEESS